MTESARIPPTPAGDTVDVLHGETIPDPYRWLENGDAPETRELDRASERADRGLPRGAARAGDDPCAARRSCSSIGALSAPVPVTRPVLLPAAGRPAEPAGALRARRGGRRRSRARRPQRPRRRRHDRARLVLPERGRPAPGVRTLRERQRAERAARARRGHRATTLPDRIPRTRSADLAWLPDATRLLLHPLSRPRRGARGRGALPSRRLLPSARRRPRGRSRWFSSRRRRSTGPGSSLSPDGRWLLIGVVAHLRRDRSLLRRSARADGPLVPVAENLPASFEGEVAHGRLFLRTNLDAPTYRLYDGGPGAARTRDRLARAGRPGQDAVLEGVHVTGRPLALSYLERASSRLHLADLEGAHRPRGPAARARQPVRRRGRVGRARALLRVLLLYRAAERLPHRPRERASSRSGAGSRPTSIRSDSRCGR